MDDIVQSLEPKVAKLEVAVEAVTKDVASLSGSIRDLSEIVQKHWQQTEGQFQQVLVAIERAAAPRKTDWHLVIGSVGLVLAIGAAAFSPMMLRTGDVQHQVSKVQSDLIDHQQLKLHPVGQTRVDALESDLKDRSERNSEAIRDLDTKLQKEFALIDAAIREKVAAIDAALREKDAKHESSIRDLDTKHENAMRDLDARLQREFTQLDAVSQKRADALTKRFDDTLPNLEQLQQRVAVLEALRVEMLRTQKR